jgi:hypothetical protein
LISMLQGHWARRLSIAMFCCTLSILLAGCHHKTMPPRLPAVSLTPDVPPTVPDSPTMKSPPPPSVPTAPVKVTQAKPKRLSKKTSAKAPPPPEVAAPVEAAATPPVSAEASPIGELTTGGAASPQLQQETTDLITSSERRAEELSKNATATQQAQLRKVTYFIRQAKQALATGDADGAKTLATKAKLLIDDLTK